ncbi:MAG: hypothetical protein ABI549_07770 [Flavobacterium sp.]|uniref:hypothetical protein n=1 Tax=Flavobacterium sp. TaxID=239 RepID=UPI003266F567
MKNIPKINFIYWVLMIIATTTGEIVGNYISRDLSLGYKIGSVLLIIIFCSTILYSIIYNKSNQLFYWLLIILGNIGGTNIADLICIDLKLGTIWGSLLVISVFLIILITIKSLSKNNDTNTTLKVTFLYWFAILTSSTFGTTSGDFLSNDTPLGAAGGTILLFILLIFFIILVHFKKISNEVFYWFSIIIIHPIGATFGNYISKPAGLNFGNVWTSVFLIILFLAIYNINEVKKIK